MLTVDFKWLDRCKIPSPLLYVFKIYNIEKIWRLQTKSLSGALYLLDSIINQT